jgi:hypothetical protein
MRWKKKKKKKKKKVNPFYLSFELKDLNFLVYSPQREPEKLIYSRQRGGRQPENKETYMTKVRSVRAKKTCVAREQSNETNHKDSYPESRIFRGLPLAGSAGVRPGSLTLPG